MVSFYQLTLHLISGYDLAGLPEAIVPAFILPPTSELAAITAKYNEVVSKLKDAERELESTKELLRIAQGMTQEEVDKKNVEMAGKLKPYYNAYKELDKQEMSVETGKMLKFILNDMLKVLARYDIKMQ